MGNQRGKKKRSKHGPTPPASSEDPTPSQASRNLNHQDPTASNASSASSAAESSHLRTSQPRATRAATSDQLWWPVPDHFELPPSLSVEVSQLNLALGLSATGEGTPTLWAPFGSRRSDFITDIQRRGRRGSASDCNIEKISTGNPFDLDFACVGMQRQTSLPSIPTMSQQQQQQQQAAAVANSNVATNGVGGGGGAMNGMAGMPINAGQQMDVNMVYQKLMELSEVLKENREKTVGILAGAEELATRAAATGASPSLQQANAEVSAARIADLTRKVNNLDKLKQVLMREQRENNKLIGEYETAMGNIVELVRNFSHNKDMEKFAQARQYNSLLQDEKDAHLATRLERDEWYARWLRASEMIRTAYRLRCEEEELPIRIVAGLQNEVRTYRLALGMEPEKFEDEYGYEILKHVKNGAGEP